MRDSARRVVLALAALLVAFLVAAATPLAAPLRAQGTPAPPAPPPPERPKLDKRADPNDWEPYFDHGVQQLNLHRPSEAEKAFWWSSQINPERAEPIFGRWVAFWMSDYKRWSMYLDDDPRVLRRPDVIAADSLPRRALERNPFVHQGLAVLLYDQMPGSWLAYVLTRAWLEYAQARFAPAVRDLDRALRDNPKSHVWIRTTRAQAFVALGQYDSTAAELHALDAEMTVRADRELGGYQSKEMLHYALGVLAAARGRTAEARTELGTALTENLGFAPAHDLLAQVAFARGDTAAAVTESEQAAQLSPDDAVLQYRYGVTLLRVDRAADAIAPLRRATALRPWFAAPFYELGIALDETGDKAGARTALARFAELAPRSDSVRIAAARRY